MIRRARTLCAAALSAMVLAACGGQDSGTTQPAPTFNQADVDYAVAMSMHHSQAVDMAGLADTQARSPKIKALAGRIHETQATEVDRIAVWLQDWGSKGATMPPHGSDDEEVHGPGMLSLEEMDKLERASGRQFDRMFLTMMIRHHEGGIQLAQGESTRGRSAEARQVAEDIKTTQAAEITQMKQLLAEV